jgi:tetraacyldisaccharide 4'-kinase
MNGHLATYWRSLASGSLNSMPGRLLLAVLAVPALVYGEIQRLRAAAYRAGCPGTRRLPRPVVSIGNITAGGTGKTPVTAYIARQLIGQGLSVAVLSRGYGGSLEGRCAVVSDGTNLLLTADECGDEPYLLASTIAGLMVVIGPDRYQAGCLALESMNVDVFLLDDGFQHLRLHRDLNILLLDGTKPFGNGWTLPAGLLREPASAVQRANLIIRTRCPEGDFPEVAVGIPAISSRHELADAVPLSGGERIPLTELRGRRVLAFAGIAEPDSFFNELRNQGIDVVRTVAFADHTRYGDEQVATIGSGLRESGASLLLTTEKDGVKLQDMPAEMAGEIFLVRLKLVFVDPEPLTGVLRNLLQ